MDVGAYMIGMVKINKRVFFKDIFENLTKYWPGRSDLMLMIKPMLPGERPLIAIGYKQEAHNFLKLICTEEAGSTKSGITYLYKYLDPFSNDIILPVPRPLAMYKLSEYGNAVDSQNISDHYNLVLGKFLVNQCVWIRLCTEVAMGMTITNFWKVFCYGVKRDHYDKSIGIK